MIPRTSTAALQYREQTADAKEECSERCNILPTWPGRWTIPQPPRVSDLATFEHPQTYHTRMRKTRRVTCTGGPGGPQGKGGRRGDISRKLSRELSYPFYSQSNLHRIEASHRHSDASLPVAEANIATSGRVTTAFMPRGKLHTHTHTPACTHVRMYSQTFTHIRIYARTHILMHALTYSCMHKLTLTHTHACMHICVCAHTHMHTCMFTHTPCTNRVRTCTHTCMHT